MDLVIISDNYPSDRMPNKGAFVYNLVQELSQYHTITVVAPFKIHDLLKPKTKEGYGEERCKVYRPLYLSVSNKKKVGIDLGFWSGYFKARAVEKCLKELGRRPDMVYAHFLSNAQSGLSYIRKNNIPLVIASGESSYANLSKNIRKDMGDLKKYARQLICVSETNRNGLKELGFQEDKMVIFPNAVDYNLFTPLDKNSCKEKFGIEKEKFVVGFVGHFINRKGPNRIIEAINLLDDKDVQLVCVGGKGNLLPNSFTTAIAPLPNHKLPELYNAFDIFVLPTLGEGHCNAIEEAKACCIPVASSLGTSVEMQIDDEIGILLDPMDINEIAQAISKLKSEHTIRDRMIENLKKRRGQNSLLKRAKKISILLRDILDNTNISEGFIGHTGR